MKVKKTLANLMILSCLATLPAMAAETMTGVISDSYCGAKHNMKGMTDETCVRDCVKAGAKYILVVPDGKIYTLDGNAADFYKFAAKKVTVSGDVNGKVLKVSSIAAAK